MTSARHKSERIKAVAALAILLLLVGGAAVWTMPWKRAQYDEVTFCPKDGQYARTAILIDATDALGDVHIKSAIEQATQLVRSRLSLHEWTGVFVLNDDNLTLPSPQVALCNPGGESSCNPVFTNCKDAGRAFKKKFEAPMTSAIQGLAGLPPDEKSPILEMIRAVALDPGFDSSQPRRLIIISDMLQHAPGAYSHYNGDFDFAKWREGEYARDFLQLSLAGTKVEIWYVKRANLGHLQTHGHVEFWNQFFNAAGARVEKLVRL